MSTFLRLNSNDVIKGLAVAVLGALVAYFAQVLNAPGFDFAGIQWDEVLKLAITSGLAYLSKQMLTTSDGKLLGLAKVG
jgi:hypothetical protein